MIMTLNELPCEVLHTGVTKGKDRYTKVKCKQVKLEKKWNNI